MTNDSKTSADSRHFEIPASKLEIAVVALLATCLVAAAASWVYAHGFILYYGDAQSHLSISRSIADSRRPGLLQLGNVWLPMLHLICLPFVLSDFLWSSGLAGTIPVAACFVLAVLCFYVAARDAYGSAIPAGVTAACFALNPNVLYLAAIPMTEVVFFLGVSIELFALLRFRATQSLRYVLVAAGGSLWASLTRYDGWFLIPFVAAAILLMARKSRLKFVMLFLTLAGLGPSYWLAHNWWQTGDALSFYRGPSSAKDIYERGLRAGRPPDPEDHHLPIAVKYYVTAGRFVLGWPLLLIGGAGMVAGWIQKRRTAVVFLALTPCFYVLSMYSSGNPIHVPNLWPFSYYNTRYATALLPLCAFGAGALAMAVPKNLRWAGALLPLAAVFPWLIHPAHDNWICLKESQRNSTSRRFWTAQAAQYLRANYHQGEGILFSDGDVPGVFGKAGIRLSESWKPGDGVGWLVNNYHPELLRTCKWAIVIEAADRDPLAMPMDRANWKRTVYDAVLEVRTKDDPVVRVYRRSW